MSLVVDLSITRRNGKLHMLDRLLIRRTKPLENPESPDDEEHRYEVSIYSTDEETRMVKLSGLAEVTHRYGDGAWALVTKSIAALEAEKEGVPS